MAPLRDKQGKVMASDFQNTLIYIRDFRIRDIKSFFKIIYIEKRVGTGGRLRHKQGM